MERKCSPSPLNTHAHGSHYAKAWLYKTPQIGQQIAREKQNQNQQTVGQVLAYP